MKRKFCGELTLLLTILFCLSANAQQDVLKSDQAVKFSLKNGEQRNFVLDLKKGDYTEISWTDKLDRSPSFSMISPTGKNILDDLYPDNPLPFVAKEDGLYSWTVKFADTDDESRGDVEISYSNAFELPKSARMKRQKKINGYEVSVYNANDEEAAGYGTYLLIRKDGKLIDILKGGITAGDGFTFVDSFDENSFTGSKRSAAFFRSTIDKTGDGTPDVAVQFYTGGAHCCIDLHFFELGKDGVRKIKTVHGMDSDVIAIGKNPKGGLTLRTGDSTFAYWLTSFAGSPIPTVILTFQNGEFRPDARLMRKPAPSRIVLSRKAAQARKNINLKPYSGAVYGDFMEAFWGEMLDLMYSGNEKSAWQFFDLVWDSRKAGKEEFKQDFLQKLSESQFWQMLQADRRQ